MKCEKCEKTFSRKSTLKTHILSHSGKILLECKFYACFKKFYDKEKLEAHSKKHVKYIILRRIL